MKNQKCCFCEKDYGEHGNNPFPVNKNPKARCCEDCNMKIVVVARLRQLKWKEVICNKLYQTCGINNAVADDLNFAKEIVNALGKYALMDWGDTCKSDSNMNDKAVYFNNDRIVAKYITSKGNIFIITESNRSATTILFAHEY